MDGWIDGWLTDGWTDGWFNGPVIVVGELVLYLSTIIGLFYEYGMNIRSVDVLASIILAGRCTTLTQSTSSQETK